jgi:Asparagine synthase
MEFRFPFLDLRLIKTAWSLPAIPFRYYKFVLRRTVQGNLPAQILARPKQPLVADPFRYNAEVLAKKWQSMQDANGMFSRYCSQAPSPACEVVSADPYTSLRFYELASWMRHHVPEGC